MSSPELGNSTATPKSSLVQCRPLLRNPTASRAFRSLGDGRGQRSRSVGWYSPPAQYSSAVPPTTIGLLLRIVVNAAARRSRCRSRDLALGILRRRASATSQARLASLVTTSL